MTASELPTAREGRVAADLVDIAALGRYPVVRELGAGGMGAVLCVRDPELRREMAAKVALDRADAALDKFVREAQVTGLLEHPGIPPVHELGRSADGRVYFTMKRVEGHDLAAVIQDLRAGAARPTITERLEIFLKVCDAVAFAHSKDVIHRDIKPANIMVGAFGEVLVMDWGLARVLGHHDADHGPTSSRDGHGDGDPLATLEGTVMGTPAYMPPEQAGGEIGRLDARSDVYALGALLYELLTFEPPYAGPTAFAVLAQVLDGPPVPPRERAPARDVPWELDAVVRRAMAPEMTDRYPSVGDLRADIVSWLEGRRVRAARYGLTAALVVWARSHRHALTVAAAALVVGVTVLGAMAVQRRRTLAALVAQADELASEHPESSLDALDRALALAPGHLPARVARDALIAGQADRALGGLPDSAALEARWRARQEALDRGEPERPETLEELAERERCVDRHLAAVTWLDRALAPVPPQLVSRRLAAGHGVAWAALLGRDYTLVRQAAGALAARGPDGRALAGRLEAAAREDREARVALWRRRVRDAATDLKAGLGRPDRPPGAPLRDDWLLELSAYRHPDVAADLGARIDEHLTRRGSDAPWTQAERDLAHVLVHALGHLRLPESVPPLADWFAAVRDPSLAVEAGLALCNTRCPQALGPLLEARDRWGLNSSVWRQIARNLSRVPRELDAGAQPRSARDYFDRALVWMDQGEFDRAIADLDQTIAIDPRHPRAFSNRGLVHRYKGELDRAIADFDQAVTLDPHHPSAFFNRGQAHAAKGETDRAIADFDQAIALDPRLALAYNSRGYAHGSKGDLVRAIEDFDHAIALDPGYAAAYRNRGQAYQDKGELDRASADLDQAIALDPRDAPAFYNRGRIHQAKGELDRAIADFDQVILLDPSNASAFNNRGTVRQAKGELDRAIADFDQTIALAPTHWRAWANRGFALARLGRSDEAIAALSRAIELAPAGERARIEALQRQVRGR